MECVDLTSDAEDGPSGPAGTGRAPGPPAGPAGDACISLLSSDGDSPLPASRSRLAGSPAPAAAPEQAAGGRTRPARTLRKVYTDGFDVDELSSPEQAPSPKRRRRTGAAAAALATPDSVGEPIWEPEEESAEEEPSPPPPPPPAARGRRGRLTAEERAEREAAKAAEKARKQQARAEAREARRQEQAAAKAARQAEAAQRRLARRRETGRTALADLTVHLDPELAKHRTGREVMRALEEAFGPAGAGGPGVELSGRLPLWPMRSLTWSRAVHAEEAGGGGEPGQEAVPCTALCFTAEEFVGHIEADGLAGVVGRAAAACGGASLLLLVEGLEHHLALRQRRDFQAHGPAGGGFSRAPIDDFLGGMACRWPGVRHACVADAAAAAEHLAGLTRALAEQPFRAEAAYVSSFGAGKPDSQAMNELLKKAPLPGGADRQAWFRALACIPALGPQIAHVVCSEHPSMGALIAAYQAAPGDLRARQGMLADMVRFGGQRVGPANSKKVFDVLMSDDPMLCIQDR